MNEALRAIAAAGTARLYSAAAALGTLTIVARCLGPGGRGTAAAALSWPTMLAMIGSLSLGQVALHRATRHRGRPWMAETAGSLLAFTALVTALGLLLTFAVYRLGPGPLTGIPPLTCALAALHLPFLLWDLFGSGLLVAAGDLPAYNRALVMGRTLALLATLVVLPLLGLGLNAALGASLLGQAAASSGSLRAVLRRSDGPLKPSLAVAGELFGGGARLHLSALGTGWVNAAVALLLQARAGAAQTGYFSLANDMLNVLFLFSQAVPQVLGGDAAARGPDESFRLTWRLLPKLLGLALLAVAISYACAPPAIRLVLGEQYLPAVGPFRILLITVLPQMLAVAASTQWIARGLFWQASAAMAVVAAVNLALAFLWVPAHGALGAAAAGAVAFALVALINLGLLGWIARQPKSPA